MIKLRGFTLLELMITLAIVAILAAITLPSYHHYMEKARFTEIITSAEKYKIAIALCAQSLSELSTCHTSEQGIPPPMENRGNIGKISVEPGGKITAVSRHLSQPYTYLLSPHLEEDGTLIWQISGTCQQASLC